ncbi:DUF3147 family protein [Sphingobium sp. SJ10-10]|uniref:DUF3147 family protein n=1 Tax=Sphingobium sp. SJ10-10 TaxID=3114999 RepID=UPI002E181C8F|nr:DUF3147 family protein [Sphingobium sp. SJ10-10]
MSAMLALRALISGIIIAIVSVVSRRYPGLGALIASLPLISVMGMIWLWNDKPDVENMARHAEATFYYVIPSLPMFLLIPMLLRRGVGFGPALIAGCALTILLYLLTVAIAARMGIRL